MSKNTIIIKGIALIVAVLFIGIIVIPSAISTTIKESRMQTFDRNILYVGGWGPNNYTMIQEAIDDSSNGDTVFVYDYSSPYYERVVVTKSIDLVGENKETTIIDAMWDGAAVITAVDNVVIEGFTLRNGSNCGIEISEHYNLVVGNNLRHNRIGLILDDCNFNVIKKNSFMYNGYGGMGCGSVWYTQIIENHFEWTNNALSIYSLGQPSRYNNISGNVFINNDRALWMMHSDYNIINRNNFSYDSDCGVFISAWCSQNHVFNNNFIGNELNAKDLNPEDINFWNASYPTGGNYWDDYNGSDEYSGPDQNIPGSDGIGDISYYIFDQKWDEYPLMNPIGLPVPELKIKSISGGDEIIISIENIGDSSATDLDVNITITGGFIMFPGDYEYLDNIQVGDSIEITMSMFGIGLGIFTPIPEITVSVTCDEESSDEKSVEARIFLSKVTIQE